jgi:hypothetical protein
MKSNPRVKLPREQTEPQGVCKLTVIFKYYFSCNLNGNMECFNIAADARADCVFKKMLN